MADTALPIGGLPDAGALADTDKLEIERGDAAEAVGLRATVAGIIARVLAKFVAGSGVRIAIAVGEATLSAGGASVVDIAGSTTLGLQHADRFIRCTSNSATTITVPAQTTVVWPNDIQLEGVQWGTGLVSFVGAAGVNVRRSSKLAATTDGQYATWGLKRIAANEWLLFGQMGSA